MGEVGVWRPDMIISFCDFMCKSKIYEELMLHENRKITVT